MFSANRKQLLEAAARNHMVGVYSSPEWADEGGLFSYGTSSIEPYRQAAIYVDKILKGSKPGELPIEQVSKLELTVNLKTARTLGISVPQSILLRAERVIE